MGWWWWWECEWEWECRGRDLAEDGVAAAAIGDAPAGCVFGVLPV